MGTKKVKKEGIQQRVDQLKVKVINIHDEALQLSDNLVDASLTTGAKWQKLMAKAFNDGTVLLDKQQDLTLSVLEEVKGQYISGAKRFRKLFGLDMPKSRKKSKAKKAMKENVAKTAARAGRKVRTASSKSDVAKDDLKIIDGIGPKIESLLNQAGIFNFKRLIATDQKELRKILDAAGPTFRTHNPETWKEQAQLAISGKLAK